MTVPAVSQDYTLSEIGLPCETDRAWAAGFFDGEGCTCANVSKGTTLRVSMAQAKDAASLRRFAAIVGVGGITGPYAPKKPGWHEQTFFNAHGKHALHILAVVWPYLGDVKKEQALAAIEKWQTEKQQRALVAQRRRADRMRATRERTHCKRGHALTEGNVYFHKRDLCPYCRTCQRERSRQSYYRRKTANT